MLARQKIWTSAASHFPNHFLKYSEIFMHHDPVSRASLELLNLTPSSLQLALAPAKRRPQVPCSPPDTVAEMLAVGFTVTQRVCDEMMGSTRMSDGCIAALVDCLNSFHIMERIIPQPHPHVSVNLQLQYHDISALKEGTHVVLVSTLEKLGKRIAYCRTDIYADPVEVSVEIARQDAAVTTVEDLKVALKNYHKLVHSSHVKVIIESSVERSDGMKSK